MNFNNQPALWNQFPVIYDNKSIIHNSNNNHNNHNNLGSWDVICGRCSDAYSNVGNRRFRVIVNLNLQRYVDARSRNDRGNVIQSVAQSLRHDMGARFLKKCNNGDFVELDDKIIRQKVGHALRDMAVQQRFDGSPSFSSLQLPYPVKSEDQSIITKSSSQQAEEEECSVFSCLEEEEKDKDRSTTSVIEEDGNAIYSLEDNKNIQSTRVKEVDLNDNIFGDDFLTEDLSVQEEEMSVSAAGIFPEVVTVTPDTPTYVHNFDKLVEHMDSIDSRLAVYGGDGEPDASLDLLPFAILVRPQKA
jgi:hypothetical protein